MTFPPADIDTGLFVDRLRELKQSAKFPLKDGAYLRPVNESDVSDSYVDGLNDPEVNKFMTAARENIQTRSKVADYVRSNHENDSDLLLGLFIKDALRGTFRLYNINWEESNGWIGLSIFDKHFWGQGWAGLSLKALTRIGHEDLDLDRLHACAYHSNEASLRTFISAGYDYQPELDTENDYDLRCFFISNRNHS